MDWYEHAVVYQIYPLGMCGAPYVNDGKCEHRLLEVIDWIDHLKGLGVTCVLFNPLFMSETHGYDTRDYATVDNRLGDNDDLKKVVAALHAAGIRVLVDGVFNHVGRGFWAFADVLANRQASAYCGWFRISWDGNTGFNDGFWYDSWEGCENIVRLNLANPAVRSYLLDIVRGWVSEFDIDGIRLDVAYCLDHQYLRELRALANEVKPDFLLVGEVLGGDYNQWMNDGECHSVTNYECYKGLWSSFNTGNMHEIAYSIDRQSGDKPWDLYTGKHLLDFVDNHDVTRIATQIADKAMLKPLYGLLFGMPGVPCVYYGSEWGIEGVKKPYEHEIRPAIAAPEENDLTAWIASLSAAHKESEAICEGTYREVLCQPCQLIFERRVEGERVLVAVNSSSGPCHVDFDAGCGQATDLITGDIHDFGGGSDLAPFSCSYWRCER